MRLLLTSAGIKNTSIRDALVDLLGKPIAESSALFIPTAIYPFRGGAGMAWQAMSGKAKSPLCGGVFMPQLQTGLAAISHAQRGHRIRRWLVFRLDASRGDITSHTGTSSSEHTGVAGADRAATRRRISHRWP